MPTTHSTEAVSQQAALQQLLSKQKAYSQSLRTSTPKERIGKLRRLREVILSKREAIQQAIFADFGKPAEEVDLSEVLLVTQNIQYVVRHLKRWMKPKKVGATLSLLGTRSEIRYEPKGTALIISPWNYPFSLCVNPLVQAVAAGNTAILKPSEFTPNTTEVIDSIISAVFEPQEVKVVKGGVEVSQALLKLKFDHIYFTGSPAVGKIVMRAAADHLTSVTLELGGKSPTIVDETADLKDAAEKIAWGKFLNAGQTCIAPDYLFVHEKVKQPFLSLLKEQVAKCYPDATVKGGSQHIARIINEKHHSRLSELIGNALEQGSELITGGNTEHGGQYIAPTVLADVPETANLMEEEIFGPVMPIMAYGDLGQVIDFINMREKPLAFYVFSKSKVNTERLLQQTSAGGCCVNETLLHFSHPELPFGGVNNSGIGKGHGHFGFKEFSNEKPVLKQRIGFTPVKLLMPPFGAKTKKLVGQMIKFLG